MKTTIDALRWVPAWTSHMGCLLGCARALKVPLDGPWLYGGTGHAFVMNVHEAVCPSGPTAWRTMRLFELARHVGLDVTGHFAHREQEDFAAVQEAAWGFARDALDAGLPCYAWELAVPEFYVIYGYDDTGYYYAGPGCEGGAGPKDWHELGQTEIGVLELYRVAPRPAAADGEVLASAAEFALAFAEASNPWTFDRYRSGLGAYDLWTSALEDGRASDMGTRYNAGVWRECRANAAAFLKVAAERVGGDARPMATEAAARYAEVAEALTVVADLYPWRDGAEDSDTLPVDATSRRAVEALGAARAAEAAGLEALRGVRARPTL